MEQAIRKKAHLQPGLVRRKPVGIGFIFNWLAAQPLKNQIATLNTAMNLIFLLVNMLLLLFILI
jgi:hypothetical protein